jgi:hypothetical protein
MTSTARPPTTPPAIAPALFAGAGDTVTFELALEAEGLADGAVEEPLP